MNKPDCNNCEYKKNLAGNAHIECKHPYVDDNELIKVAVLMRAAVVYLGQMPDGDIFSPLNIRANEHGIKKGWFVWPINFDPAWLENCDGFKEKK